VRDTAVLNPFNDNTPPESEPQAIPRPTRQPTSPGPIKRVQSNSGETPDLLESYKRLLQGDKLMAERDDIREEIKDKLATAEAKTETRLSKLESQFALGVIELKGQIGLLGNDIAAVRRDKWVILGTIAAGVFGLAALIVALATYGDAMFGRGINVRDVVQTTIKETLEQAKKP
jgi:hypothetical protein